MYTIFIFVIFIDIVSISFISMYTISISFIFTYVYYIIIYKRVKLIYFRLNRRNDGFLGFLYRCLDYVYIGPWKIRTSDLYLIKVSL